MNTYGVVILIVITIISSYIIILHYKNITQNITLKKNAKKEGIVPTAYYYLIGFTLVCVYLKIHALRKYTMKKLSDIFLTQFLIKKVDVDYILLMCIFLNNSDSRIYTPQKFFDPLKSSIFGRFSLKATQIKDTDWLSAVKVRKWLSAGRYFFTGRLRWRRKGR